MEAAAQRKEEGHLCPSTPDLPDLTHFLSCIRLTTLWLHIFMKLEHAVAGKAAWEGWFRSTAAPLASLQVALAVGGQAGGRRVGGRACGVGRHLRRR